MKRLRMRCGFDADGFRSLGELAAPDFVLDGSRPIDRVAGGEAAGELLAQPLLAGFPHLEDRLDILIEGTFAGGAWTASTGHLAGIFERPLWGIPATGLPAFLRYGRFDRWVDGRIVQMHLILDLPGLMMQAGVWPLARPLGAFWPPPGPATRDGVVTDEGDAQEASRSLALVEAMIAALMTYDGGPDLSHMRMVDYWTRDFWWFGPAAIGSFCGHADYERGHQRPFLTAFPDRRGGDHKCRIGERGYVASAGWPSIRATHSGGGWLGLPPTGRAVTMRVMDFWRRDGARLAENWVFIDIPDLLHQIGVDMFARMRELAPAPMRG